ncbi:GlsB/YeaQ/YmgE family stress response membrane protein [Microvirga lenta]|uniref:GlsB/YeaQ/YmgE family stress response membrane protein n=1 Tax=Microvirga lenta TaxID=2881337 RepID=UPI001CFF9B8F|nr:GlsB/YeaQ/YmgE family stress response membrane protein [Microvirga lenta]MCB5176919.1 GlsB/YeaQ/YmgE family stress response membrane protein [Microvirga lenta]
MSIMWIVALGLVVGVIARLVTPGRKGPFGFMLTGVLGIVGAFAASYLGQEAGWYQAEDSTGLVAAVFGAVVLLLIWGSLFRSRRPTSSI